MCILIFLCVTFPASAATLSDEEIYKKRMELYKKYEKISGVSWYEIAAIDQYNRNIRKVRKDLPSATSQIIGLYVNKKEWFGPIGEKLNIRHAGVLQAIGGMAIDGDGDGKAELENDEDVLATFLHLYRIYDVKKNRYTVDINALFPREQTKKIIRNYGKIYKRYNNIQLSRHVFPVPIGSRYSVKYSYGAPRSFGGRRIHEGVDIFAPHGVPVRSITYGIVEVKGWNRLGGWRIGIRDLYNNYHYYAHLGGFSKGIHEGDIVEPGMVVGFVGSSGYGQPGTSGKFPPHLHYGIYKDNGRTEWSFNPSFFLERWKLEEKTFASKEKNTN